MPSFSLRPTFPIAAVGVLAAAALAIAHAWPLQEVRGADHLQRSEETPSDREVRGLLKALPPFADNVFVVRRFERLKLLEAPPRPANSSRPSVPCNPDREVMRIALETALWPWDYTSKQLGDFLRQQHDAGNLKFMAAIRASEVLAEGSPDVHQFCYVVALESGIKEGELANFLSAGETADGPRDLPLYRQYRLNFEGGRSVVHYVAAVNRRVMVCGCGQQLLNAVLRAMAPDSPQFPAKHELLTDTDLQAPLCGACAYSAGHDSIDLWQIASGARIVADRTSPGKIGFQMHLRRDGDATRLERALGDYVLNEFPGRIAFREGPAKTVAFDFRASSDLFSELGNEDGAVTAPPQHSMLLVILMLRWFELHGSFNSGLGDGVDGLDERDVFDFPAR